VIVLISVALLTFQNLNNYTDEVKAIRHSNSVLSAVSDIMTSIRDAETGHRGFQLTRDTTYLDPYYSSLNALPRQISALDSLVADNEEQAKRADTLELLIENQFSIINQILNNAARSSLYMDRYESNLLKHGKENMNAIRRVSQQIDEAEQEFYEQRMSDETGFRELAPISLLVFTLVAISAVTFLFTRAYDALNKKGTAEDLLRENIKALKNEVLGREERELILREAESLANLGSWKWFEHSGQLVCSDGLYILWERERSGNSITWSDFLHNVYSEDRELVEQFVRDVQVRKQQTQINYRMEMHGRMKYLFMSVRPRANPQHKSTDILGIVMDITEQKVSEAQLKQFTSELQRSNQDLEQFAFVASHDLQEPLRKIRAFGDRLMSKYKNALEENGADYVTRMQSAAERMQRLIEELLSFSRVSRPAVLFEGLQVEELIQEIIDDLDAQVKRENAVIRFGKIPTIRGERSQVKRLFQNLISNAIKFHKPGQKAVVNISGQRVRNYEILQQLGVQLQHQEYVKIEVKDEGIGFDEKYTDKIFNIFQRLHGRMEYEGTGIGLAICRKIVTNHGGFITARSTENVGSTFIVILPIEN
jgi:signal transduction histidine kinase